MGEQPEVREEPHVDKEEDRAVNQDGSGRVQHRVVVLQDIAVQLDEAVHQDTAVVKGMAVQQDRAVPEDMLVLQERSASQKDGEPGQMTLDNTGEQLQPLCNSQPTQEDGSSLSEVRKGKVIDNSQAVENDVEESKRQVGGWERTGVSTDAAQVGMDHSLNSLEGTAGRFRVRSLEASPELRAETPVRWDSHEKVDQEKDSRAKVNQEKDSLEKGDQEKEDSHNQVDQEKEDSHEKGNQENDSHEKDLHDRAGHEENAHENEDHKKKSQEINGHKKVDKTSTKAVAVPKRLPLEDFDDMLHHVGSWGRSVHHYYIYTYINNMI